MTDAADAIKKRYEVLKPVLDERVLRRFAAAEATTYGYGGITLLAQITGLARSTIINGINEIKVENHARKGRVRRAGGGRKSLIEKDPSLLDDLKKLVEPDTLGDPMQPLLWTSKSTAKLSKALKKMGHSISPKTVAKLLREKLGYSLQGNKKTQEGKDHPDRDEQFKYINTQAQKHMQIGAPVISVDTKKKELVGNFKNAGREWHKQSSPPKVNTHDFPDPTLGKVAPYGVYDIYDNKGWVSVGIDNDTSAFAVNSIRSWWKNMGRAKYVGTKSLMITADCGGSNSNRWRLWKVELQKLADELGIEITVCHFPPGTSKWNKIEHRLFSFITKNWRGRPLVSLRTIIELISATTTETGLEVRSELDQNKYPKGIKISDEKMASINLERHDFHGEWNYTISPQRVFYL